MQDDLSCLTIHPKTGPYTGPEFGTKYNEKSGIYTVRPRKQTRRTQKKKHRTEDTREGEHDQEDYKLFRTLASKTNTPGGYWWTVQAVYDLHQRRKHEGAQRREKTHRKTLKALQYDGVDKDTTVVDSGYLRAGRPRRVYVGYACEYRRPPIPKPGKNSNQRSTGDVTIFWKLGHVIEAMGQDGKPREGGRKVGLVLDSNDVCRVLVDTAYINDTEANVLAHSVLVPRKDVRGVRGRGRASCKSDDVVGYRLEAMLSKCITHLHMRLVRAQKDKSNDDSSEYTPDCHMIVISYNKPLPVPRNVPKGNLGQSWDCCRVTHTTTCCSVCNNRSPHAKTYIILHDKWVEDKVVQCFQDPQTGGGGGVAAIYGWLRRAYLGVTRDAVHTAMQKMERFQLRQGTLFGGDKSKGYSAINYKITTKTHQRWQLDIKIMPRSFSGNYKGIYHDRFVVVVDTFSRKCWAWPLLVRHTQDKYGEANDNRSNWDEPASFGEQLTGLSSGDRHSSPFPEFSNHGIERGGDLKCFQGNHKAGIHLGMTLLELFNLFGRPHELMTDNALEFGSSSLLGLLCTKYNIRLLKTPTYAPDVNAMVEARNKSLSTRLKYACLTRCTEASIKLNDVQHYKWICHLSSVVYAYNNTPHNSLGNELTPEYIHTGRDEDVAKLLQFGNLRIDEKKVHTCTVVDTTRGTVVCKVDPDGDISMDDDNDDSDDDSDDDRDDHDDRDDEHNYDRVIKKQGFYRTNVGGDGNCLYRAMLYKAAPQMIKDFATGLNLDLLNITNEAFLESNHHDIMVVINEVRKRAALQMYKKLEVKQKQKVDDVSDINGIKDTSMSFLLLHIEDDITNGGKNKLLQWKNYYIGTNAAWGDNLMIIALGNLLKLNVEVWVSTHDQSPKSEGRRTLIYSGYSVHKPEEYNRSVILHNIKIKKDKQPAAGRHFEIFTPSLFSGPRIPTATGRTSDGQKDLLTGGLVSDAKPNNRSSENMNNKHRQNANRELVAGQVNNYQLYRYNKESTNTLKGQPGDVAGKVVDFLQRTIAKIWEPVFIGSTVRLYLFHDPNKRKEIKSAGRSVNIDDVYGLKPDWSHEMFKVVDIRYTPKHLKEKHQDKKKTSYIWAQQVPDDTGRTLKGVSLKDVNHDGKYRYTIKQCKPKHNIGFGEKMSWANQKGAIYGIYKNYHKYQRFIEPDKDPTLQWTWASSDVMGTQFTRGDLQVIKTTMLGGTRSGAMNRPTADTVGGITGDRNNTRTHTTTTDDNSDATNDDDAVDNYYATLDNKLVTLFKENFTYKTAKHTKALAKGLLLVRSKARLKEINENITNQYKDTFRKVLRDTLQESNRPFIEDSPVYGKVNRTKDREQITTRHIKENNFEVLELGRGGKALKMTVVFAFPKNSHFQMYNAFRNTERNNYTEYKHPSNSKGFASCEGYISENAGRFKYDNKGIRMANDHLDANKNEIDILGVEIIPYTTELPHEHSKRSPPFVYHVRGSSEYIKNQIDHFDAVNRAVPAGAANVKDNDNVLPYLLEYHNYYKSHENKIESIKDANIAYSIKSHGSSQTRETIYEREEGLTVTGEPQFEYATGPVFIPRLVWAILTTNLGQELDLGALNEKNHGLQPGNKVGEWVELEDAGGTCDSCNTSFTNNDPWVFSIKTNNNESDNIDYCVRCMVHVTPTASGIAFTESDHAYNKTNRGKVDELYRKNVKTRVGDYGYINGHEIKQLCKVVRIYEQTSKVKLVMFKRLCTDKHSDVLASNYIDEAAAAWDKMTYANELTQLFETIRPDKNNDSYGENYPSGNKTDDLAWAGDCIDCHIYVADYIQKLVTIPEAGFFNLRIGYKPSNTAKNNVPLNDDGTEYLYNNIPRSPGDLFVPPCWYDLINKANKWRIENRLS